MEVLEVKSAFVSYSWTTPEHEDWVFDLANRLRGDGVDVKLDKWDLREGQDKFEFMESMVTSKDIDKVLIILDKKYAQRADNREGGVGTETMIITPSVYSDARQEKFIPIVAELDEHGQAYLPSYLKGRIYIDCSSTENLERNYEQLLRNIYGRPSLTKPKLGKAPSYLLEETPMQFRTTMIVRGFDAQIDKNPNRINSLLRDFAEDFFDNLKAFVLKDNIPAQNDVMGPAILDLLHQYQPLKNDYITILDKTLKSGLEFDYEIFLDLLARIPLLLEPIENPSGSWQPFRYEHFKLISHELFLYSVASSLKIKHYRFIEELLYHRYVIREGRSGRADLQTFSGFYQTYNVLDDYYKQQKQKNYYSVHAELIISNSVQNLPRELITNADLLCYYVAKLNKDYWFPLTYVYSDRYNRNFEFFSKLISNRHFDRIKGILGVETLDELKQKIEELNAEGRQRGFGSMADPLPMITDYIKVDLIGTAR